MASYAIKHVLLVSAVITITFFFSYSRAATFGITNNCPYTVWAAAAGGGLSGGQQLDQGQSWQIYVAPGTAGARIWGRTGCNFDGNGANGNCQTGDCNGLLQCQGYGRDPNTLAEFALNQFNNLDFVDISQVAGFNLPMTFEGIGCRTITCNANVIGSCPGPLQTPGGCNNPCTVFPINQYCCTDGPGSCGPTDYSRYFKGMCPDAYSYPQDDPTSLFTCPGGTNYNVVFCP